jgi:hypothetical protein
MASGLESLHPGFCDLCQGTDATKLDLTPMVRPRWFLLTPMVPILEKKTLRRAPFAVGEV